MRRSGVRASPGARFWNWKTEQERPRYGHPHTSVSSAISDCRLIVGNFRNYALSVRLGVLVAMVAMVPLKHPSPDEGLEPATLRLKVWCSTDWANRAYVFGKWDVCDCAFLYSNLNLAIIAKAIAIYSINEHLEHNLKEKARKTVRIYILTVGPFIIFETRKPG